MKYFIGWFAVWALLSLGCKEKVTTVNFKDWPEEKSYPYDPFFIQRSYPDKHFSVRAYQEALQKVQLDQLSESPTRFDGTWTVQGPGNLGARINTIAAVPNSSTVYVGFANGGVWKTLDGGGSWFPIFDDRLFLTVGDIAIDPNDTSTIYVGTGDPNITSYPAMGNGVFKSTDGGQSWSYLGLSETAITSKIIINPNNSNQIFVATMGLPFERNPDRGLYRSDDGGQTWQKVLYLSNQAGVIDLVMDPDHPNVLYASGWDRIRNNQESIVYGPHAKIFKSTDGGNNWATLTNGLPQNISCRIGLTICESQPNILYALYVGTDFQVSGIYKSTDGGVNWTAKGLAGLENALGGFGWYFGQIRVDPDDPDLLYVLGGYNWRSTDGGNSWQTFYAHPGHPDKHDLIFYENGLMIATDGGLYRSVDDAETLIRMDQIPANEVYRVGYNPFKPDLYYCGMQDNGTAYGHQSNINGWLIYYGGDGFQPQFSPLDSNLFYAESQYGNIGRTQDGQGLNLFGYSDYSSDRRNWDLPYMLSYFHSNVLYLGTYRAYQYDTLNLTFTTISGDLTDGNIYGDIFHSITTIDESHFVEGQLYVGTSDANVQRRNPDGSWQNITSGLPERYVTSIKTSESQAGRVFVTHSGYRDNEFIPRVHRSDDDGATWVDISGNLPDLAVNDILVIPNQADSVLVVATDGGVYASIDAGAVWKRVGDMPYVKVMDLVYNPVHHQIVAGTFGRSVMTFPIDSLKKDGDAEIQGTVKTVTGHDVPAHIGLVTPSGEMVVSDSFHFVDLSPLGPYRLMPQYDTLAEEGINVLDLLLMYQYLLGGASLTPYQKSAADVDFSGDIKIQDLLLVRKLTLGQISEFPNSQSWRFYADSTLFPLETNTFGEGDAVRIDSLPTNVIPFIGVKVGDVNESWGN